MDDEPKSFAERLELEAHTRRGLQAYLGQAHPVVVVLLDGGRVTGPGEEGAARPTGPGHWARE